MQLRRETESLAPRPHGGGNPSPIDLRLLEQIVVECGDATRSRRLHRSSVYPALRPAGYVFNKVVRPAEQGRPDVQEKRVRFIRGRSESIHRDSFLLDEAAANFRGAAPTMIGALRRDGWLTMSTIFGSASGVRFVNWIRRGLGPKLRPGDIVILDDTPHNAMRASRRFGARVEFLPPYSPDLNPIEPALAIARKHIRAAAPPDTRTLRKSRPRRTPTRQATVLRRVVRR